MTYINPLAVLNIPPDQAKSGISKTFLKREKKRLLAEFELHRTPVIEIRGQEMDRTAVLELFEMLENEAILQHHLKIYQDETLMRFLEEASLDYFYSGNVHALAANSSDFLRFLGPHFSDQFNKRLLHAFKQHDWEEIDVMVKPPMVIPPEYHAASYKDTYRHLHAKIQEIERLTEALGKAQSPGGEIQEYCDEMLITAMNHLPDYFAGSRDRYAMALEGLAIAVHNHHKRSKLGMFILKQGMKLHISEDARGRLQHVIDQLQAMMPASDSPFDWLNPEKREGVNPWMVAVGVGTGVAAWLLYRWLK